MLEGDLRRFRRSLPPDELEMPGIMPWRIRRLTEQGDRTVVGGVVVEEPLEIWLDGQLVAVLMRTPGLEKELAAGFCLGEGLLADPGDIALVRHCGRAMPDKAAGDALDGFRNRVDITSLSGLRGAVDPLDVVRMIRAGCGRADVAALSEGLTPLGADLAVSVETLIHLPAQLTRQQAAYRAAGGIHAAAIFDRQGRPLVVCEDIGRHNAVDKAVGYCLLRAIPLGDKLLLSTGRASYDMVAKGVRLGIPIMASISSPTSLAVELAEALNCTLLGYLRGKRLNIYTHGWRVMVKENEREEQSWT